RVRPNCQTKRGAIGRWTCEERSDTTRSQSYGHAGRQLWRAGVCPLDLPAAGVEVSSASTIDWSHASRTSGERATSAERKIRKPRVFAESATTSTTRPASVPAVILPNAPTRRSLIVVRHARRIAVPIGSHVFERAVTLGREVLHDRLWRDDSDAEMNSAVLKQ